MNRAAVLIALACPVFLSSVAACAPSTGVIRPVASVVCKNTSGICQIPVTVTVINGQCTVVVPDADADKTVARIQWAITAGNDGAKDVTFVAGPGIQFQNPSGWSVPATSAGAKRALAFPTASHVGAKYTVNMTNGCVLDPIINNDFD